MIIQRAGGAEQALQHTATMEDLLAREQCAEDTARRDKGANSGYGLGYSIYGRSRRRTGSGYPSGNIASHHATAGYDQYAAHGEIYRDTHTRTGPHFAPQQAGSEGSRSDEDPCTAALTVELRALKQELADTPAAAIQKNLKTFERKFRMQQREIVEEMKKVVVHEGDRVISSVLAGPHERIIDPVRSHLIHTVTWLISPTRISTRYGRTW